MDIRERTVDGLQLELEADLTRLASAAADRAIRHRAEVLVDELALHGEAETDGGTQLVRDVVGTLGEGRIEALAAGIQASSAP